MTIALEHHGGMDLAAQVREDAMRTAIVGYLRQAIQQALSLYRCSASRVRVVGDWTLRVLLRSDAP
jgi:hypothetical protein